MIKIWCTRIKIKIELEHDMINCPNNKKIQYNMNWLEKVGNKSDWKIFC